MKIKYGQAYRLASTTQLTREQWLTIRKLGIGSSDAAVAIGLSPYKCPLSLWLEKTGRKEPDDLSQKEAVLWGIELEPVLAQVYAKRTGYRVRRVGAPIRGASRGRANQALRRRWPRVGDPWARRGSSAAPSRSRKPSEGGSRRRRACRVRHRLPFPRPGDYT